MAQDVKNAEIIRRAKLGGKVGFVRFRVRLVGYRQGNLMKTRTRKPALRDICFRSRMDWDSGTESSLKILAT
jgi:hypothetical protein